MPSTTKMSHHKTKPTKWHVRPANTQISLGFRWVFAVRIKKHWALIYLLSAHLRLIRLGWWPGWSESSLGIHHFVCREVAQMTFTFTRLVCQNFFFMTFFCQNSFWQEPPVGKWDAQTMHNSIPRFELQYDKTNKMTCAPSDDSDHHGHPPSLISSRGS